MDVCAQVESIGFNGNPTMAWNNEVFESKQILQ